MSGVAPRIGLALWVRDVERQQRVISQAGSLEWRSRAIMAYPSIPTIAVQNPPDTRKMAPVA